MTRYSLSIVALFCLLAPGWADDLKTLSGKTLNGTLEKITDSSIAMKSGGATVDTAVAQVLDVTLRPARGVPAAASYIEVVLLDDSILRCNKVSLTSKEIQLELTTGVSVKAPIGAVLTILRDAHDKNIKDQWTKLIAEKKRKDRIFILKMGDLNPLEGTIGTIDDDKKTVKFKADGVGDIEPSIEKLQGMQFARTESPADASLCKIVDVDGNKLVASKVTFDGKQVNVITPFAQKVTLDPMTVAQFDFNFGRLTYLSDLDEKLTEPSFLGGFNPLRKNANLDGNPIMMQDKKYDKGLSMYAGVELEYSLGEKYKDFKALLGVDSRIAEEGQGKVTVTIYCDQEKRSTFEVSVKAPTPIAVNVKDVKTLRIVVSGSNFTGLSGHATLANAHVSQ